MEDPQRQWRDFRRRKRAFWALFLAYLPVAVGTELVVGKLQLNEQWVVAVTVLWLVAWALSGIWLSRVRCPSCSERFFLKRGVGNVWSNTCRHCERRAPRAA
jgi:hypothetical protein